MQHVQSPLHGTLLPPLQSSRHALIDLHACVPPARPGLCCQTRAHVSHLQRPSAAYLLALTAPKIDMPQLHALMRAAALPLPPPPPAATRGGSRQRRQRLVVRAAGDAAPTQLAIKKANSAAELRACGSLRAAAFTVVPPDRSEFARQVSWFVTRLATMQLASPFCDPCCQ